MSSYQFRNLTSAVNDKHSPLRQYLNRRFPNARPLQTTYREQSGSLLVDGGDANAGTVGAAFDFMVRFAVDAAYVPNLAALAFQRSPTMLSAIGEVARAAQSSAADRHDDDLLVRATWALALCTEVYRAGPMPGSPLIALIQQRTFTPETLLALAPDGGRRQLHELRTVADQRLLPTIHHADRVDLGPTFDGSALCPADADLIFDGLLLDIKTHLGTMNKRTGQRSDGLSLTDLYQVLAYTLFDTSDEYGISAVGIYSARYGALVRWPLEQVMTTMAGETVDLGEARSEVWSLLSGKAT